MTKPISVFWFRRDLRLQDNAGLYHALKSGNDVLPIFIFDKNILDKLEDNDDARVSFIHQSLEEINSQLHELGSTLNVFYGTPTEIFTKLFSEYSIKAIYANHDYEPYAKERDAGIRDLLAKQNILFRTYKDQSIFEKGEVLKYDGKPYTVFTPYKNKWVKKLDAFYLKSYPNDAYFAAFRKQSAQQIISLDQIGFSKSSIPMPGKEYEHILENYGEQRNFPAIKGTSRISVHLRFGTVSIRELAKTAIEQKADVWLNELIWRDFYFMIIHHFPHSVKNSFKPAYDKITWRNNELEFKKWCEGKTGYPIVDAGMRELNATGFMHNRVRMIVASFLTKHLLIDWRWGEAYFAKKLLDFELSSNVGGWQWAASSGCDAAPYFRIFNPEEQIKKFDKQLVYIKKWVPEFQEFEYPKPIVEHKFARERCLKVFKEALG